MTFPDLYLYFFAGALLRKCKTIALQHAQSSASVYAVLVKDWALEKAACYLGDCLSTSPL